MVNPVTIARLSYEEAMEMAHFGAGVIYLPTLAPAMKEGIPIYIKNSMDPGGHGDRGG